MRVSVKFPTGDCDCSSLIYRILVACGVMPSGLHFWTGNEQSLLSLYGFERRNLYAPKRGDVLWREGHTEMYLGDGMQGGARIDERGGVTGPKVGDQTGNEVGKSAFDLAYWRWVECWRYVGTKTVDGIPMHEAMAQLMEHAIAHDASHGYSQTNRDGDGGWEWVTLTWDAGGPALIVDGWLGPNSVHAWQHALGTVEDGVVSGQWESMRMYYRNLTAVEFGTGGSSLVCAIQSKVGASVDGYLGPNTVRGIQRFVGVAQDGYLGPDTAKAVQRSLNDGCWS